MEPAQKASVELGEKRSGMAGDTIRRKRPRAGAAHSGCNDQFREKYRLLLYGICGEGGQRLMPLPPEGVYTGATITRRMKSIRMTEHRLTGQETYLARRVRIISAVSC